MPVPRPNSVKVLVHAPQDRTQQYGSRGELYAGGRRAAGLGEWHYLAVPGGWSVRAGVHAPNDMLIDQGAEFTLRLLFGNVVAGKKTDYIFVGPALTVNRLPGHPEIVTIVGTQKLEKIERYGSGNKDAKQQRSQSAIELVRARRSIPGSGGGGGFAWDPARRQLVRGR